MKRKLRHFLGGIKALLIILFTFFLFPFARLFLWNKKIWIVSEHGYEARDNGYCFFRYIRLNHKEINCFYTISTSSKDYEKIKPLGNIIKFGSLKHYVYFCAARYIISSKTQGFCPSYYLSLLRKKFHLWGKYVFLQHGITKDDQRFLYKFNSKIDLFICGAKPEYDDILSHYGYKKREVVYTGFSRFDDYFNVVPKDCMLVMPTWRRYAENVTFRDTQYFKVWSSFLNSSRLDSVLKKNKLTLYFYLHPHFKDYYNLFKSNSCNVKVLSFEENDIRSLILNSKILITDFSSLAFDFGYLKRPVIYYQYDETEYFEKHYIKGYFDYRRDGFGPVLLTENEVIDYLQQIIADSFKLSSKYLKKVEGFFPLYDNNNSKRIYEAIMSLDARK